MFLFLCAFKEAKVMVGSSVEVEATMSLNGSLANGKSAESLAVSDLESFDPTAVVPEPVPSVVESNGEDGEKRREIVLGRNVHTTCLEVTEPDADDESTGDKDAYMASVLARYRKTLIERTKHHLGTLIALLIYVYCSTLVGRIDTLDSTSRVQIPPLHYFPSCYWI